MQVDPTILTLTGELVVASEPVDAELWIDGKRIGSANRTITLPATPHEIELRKAGYAGDRKTIAFIVRSQRTGTFRQQVYDNSVRTQLERIRGVLSPS